MKREDQIFEQAIELPPEAREAFLREACGSDPELRRGVDELLANLGDADTMAFLHSGERAPDGPVAAASPLAEGPGSWIGRYRLLQQIGEGGMGVVYMAEQREPVTRRVALKIIKVGMDTKQVVARFEAERQALALMDHPNIARVLDGGATETGRPYFVMELVQGVPITEFCDRNGLATEERLKLFIQVCHAIQSAHQKGVIHRDIKPSNVLVTLHHGEPMPKVIDFGIAKATHQRLTEKTLFTAHATMIGTPAYVSPEQAEMSSADVDTRADIYSLGVLLYELLTGTTPFPEKRLRSLAYGEMQRVIMEEEPERPSTRLNTLTHEQKTAVARSHGAEAGHLMNLLRGDLDWIVMKCLEKNRTRRYETADGLADDVARHLADDVVGARPPTTAYRIHKAVLRNKGLFGAAAAVAVALLAGITASLWQASVATQARNASLRDKAAKERETRIAQQERNRALAAHEVAEQKSREARLNLYAADMKLVQLALAEHDLGRAATLLERHKPGPGEEDFRGFEWRYLWRQTQGQETDSATLPSGAILDLAFSPDRRWLAAGGSRGVSIVDVASWQPRHFLPSDAGVGPVSVVGFSPDGATLLTGTQEEVLLWDTWNWQIRERLDGAGGVAGFSPDGRTLVSSGPGGLQVWNTAPLTRLHQLDGRTIRRQWSVGRNLAFSADGGTVAALVEDASADPADRLSLRIWKVDALRRDGASAPAQVIAHPQAPFINALALTGDGRQIAGSTTLGFVGVWDTSTGALVASRQDEPKDKSIRLSYCPGDGTLVSARSDQTLRALRADGAELVETGIALGHRSPIWSAALSPDGSRFASGDSSGVVKLWDAARLAGESPKAATRDVLPGCLVHLQFLSDNRTLAAWSGDLTNGQLGFWDTVGGEARRAFPGMVWHGAARVSPDERSVAIGRPDGVIEIVDVATQAVAATLRGATLEARRIFFTPDGRHVLAGSPMQTSERGEVFEGDSIVRLWETASGRLLQEADLSMAPAGMAMAPDGATFAVHLKDATVEVRRTADCSLVFRVAIPDIGTSGVAWSPDGRLLAVGCLANNEIRIWDLQDRQLRWKLRGHREIIHRVVFAPDGRTLASASHDRTIRFWNLATGQELISLPQAGGVFDLAFSGDGLTLAASVYTSEGGDSPWAVHLLRAPSLEEITAAQEERDDTPALEPE